MLSQPKTCFEANKEESRLALERKRKRIFPHPCQVVTKAGLNMHGLYSTSLIFLN